MRKNTKYCLIILYILFRCTSSLNSQPSEFKWAKQAGGSGGDIGSGITVDELGSSFIIGSFEDTATFGSTTMISAGHTDIFFAKYDTKGNIVWIKQIGNIGPDRGNSICMDKFGNCLVTGTFSGTVNFGTIKLTSVGGEDIFITKYDAMGNVVWAKQAGGGGDDIGYGIATDGLGNAFITGLFHGDATFDKIILRSSSSQHDIFIAKYDKLGNMFWANQTQGIWK